MKPTWTPPLTHSYVDPRKLYCNIYLDPVPGSVGIYLNPDPKRYSPIMMEKNVKFFRFRSQLRIDQIKHWRDQNLAVFDPNHPHGSEFKSPPVRRTWIVDTLSRVRRRRYQACLYALQYQDNMLLMLTIGSESRRCDYYYCLFQVAKLTEHAIIPTRGSALSAG